MKTLNFLSIFFLSMYIDKLSLVKHVKKLVTIIFCALRKLTFDKGYTKTNRNGNAYGVSYYIFCKKKILTFQRIEFRKWCISFD